MRAQTCEDDEARDDFDEELALGVTERESERRSLDTELGRHLSQLSANSKYALTLNQIHRVEVCATYERAEEDGATVYVLNVYVQNVQRGLPTRSPMSSTGSTTETKSERKRRLRREKEEERPEYQVEHRYSAFRALRQRIAEVVDVEDDALHPKWCTYCNRVMWLVTFGNFPSRYPNRGKLATYTGWHRLLVYARKHRLEVFINELLKAAKDVSYRYGGGQCERFVTVSNLVSSFLSEPSLRTSDSVW